MLIPQINMMFTCSFIIFLVLTTSDAQNRCTDSSICVNIRNCPEIRALMSVRSLSDEMFQIIINSLCGFEGYEPKVCCNQAINMRTTIMMKNTTDAPSPEPIPDPPDVTNHTSLHLLDHQACGLVGQYITEGNKTGVFQYPWMALIAFQIGESNPQFLCAGTIISSRYILTSAHCITSPWSERYKLIGVRVGDHDISKERDCETDINGNEYLCAERYQDFDVNTIIVHEEYTSTEMRNDIALIKLNGTVDFRQPNVKPICLPFGTAARVNHRWYLATGWRMAEADKRSPDLRQTRLTVVPNEQCKKIYETYVTIWYKQLCAGSHININSTCLGDSGGPLQAPGIYNGTSVRMVQYGLVSYGRLKQCNMENPAVYTRVAYYMDWILDTMNTFETL